MSSALLARRMAPMAARSTIAMRGGMAVRSVHIENTVETALPFKTGPQYKTRLLFGVFGFLGFGFSLPFIAARFQLRK